MKISKLMITTALIGAVFSSPAFAKEGGDQYPNGAEGWMAGALPPPGNYFLNYAIYYGGSLMDGNGDKALLGTTTPEVHAVADALRFVHVSEKKILGANWVWHMIVPLVYQAVDITALGGRDRLYGLGDVTISPFVLSWHMPDFHVAAGLDVNVPVGTYSRDGIAPNGYSNSDPRRDIGANYWSFEPLVAVTYLNSDGWEASGKFMFNIKTENQFTDYQSGSEFHFDYMLGKHLGAWNVGVGGYFLTQLTDDQQGGQQVTSLGYFGQDGVFSDGKRGQVFAMGPSVAYSLETGQQFQLSWDHEMLVENRFGGDKVLFKFVTPLF